MPRTAKRKKGRLMEQKKTNRMELPPGNGHVGVWPGSHIPIPLCSSCPRAQNCFLGRFDKKEMTKLQEIRQIAWYPRGVVLFFEGEATRGIYVVCSGEIKTFANSQQGGTVILRRVGQGEVLGISSSLTGSPYPVSAETLLPSQITFIPRVQFLNFLTEHPNSYRVVIEALAIQLQKSWEHARMLALHRHVVSRLAELLLTRAAEHGQESTQGTLVSFPVTQEDIAESIGTTRETVSRIFSDLRRQGILRRRGNGFLLMKPRELEALKGS